jgi:hypothetical protein
MKDVSRSVNMDSNMKLKFVNVLLQNHMVNNRSLFSQISTLWERLVLVSITCKDYKSYHSLDYVFGINDIEVALPFVSPRIDSVIIVENDGSNVDINDTSSTQRNELIVALPGQAGFEAKVLFPRDNLSIYIQIKIAASTKSPINYLLTKTILYCLADAFDSNFSRTSDIRIVYYDYGDSLDKTRSAESINGILQGFQIGGISLDENAMTIYQELCMNKVNFKQFLKDFATTHIESQKPFFHYIGKEGIAKWIIPSFLPFAQLCQAIDPTN